MKRIPLHCLVVSIGSPTPDKAKLLAKFADYEIVGAAATAHELLGDSARADIAGIVFHEIHRRAALKLSLGERVIIDAPNLRRDDRVSLAHIGIAAGVPVFYLVAPDASDPFLINEREILRGDGVAEVIDGRVTDFVVVGKLPAGDILGEVKRRGYAGLTVVGDVHGMYQALLNALSWARNRHHFLLFLGDIVDYGRETLEACDEVYRAVMRGEAEFIMGNHERKIMRWLDQTENGRVTLNLSEGNRVTTQAIEALSPNERRRWVSRFRGLLALTPQHRRVGTVLCVHGAAHPEMWSSSERRLSRVLEGLALFGEVDRNAPPRSDGYPTRTHEWVEQIARDHIVIVGHEIRSTMKPVIESNKNGGQAVFLDTGSGKGGQLTTTDLVFTTDGELKLSHFNAH